MRWKRTSSFGAISSIRACKARGIFQNYRLTEERRPSARFCVILQIATRGNRWPGVPCRRTDPTTVNSERLPSTSTLSVQAERFFKVWGQNVTFYVQGSNLLDANNINDLTPRLWPDNQLSPSSYRVYYTETGRAGGAFLTLDQNGDGIEDWYAVNDPRVFEQGRVIRVGLGVQF